MLKYYVGVTYFHNTLIFRAEPDNVTRENMPEFVFCFGPYATRKKATQVAMFQNYAIKNGRNVATPILPR